MQPGLHVSELCKLTGLTCLRVKYRSYDLEAFQESMKGLVAVTQLRSLFVKVVGMQDGPVAGLLPLTNLTALTKLCFDCIRDTIRDDYRIFFKQEVGKLSAAGPAGSARCLHSTAQHQRVSWLLKYRLK
jgi:hypothetical protein